MDLRKVRQMAKLMNEMGLTALEITEGDATVKLERKETAVAAVATTPVPLSPLFAEKAQESSETAPVDDGLITITAPMVGVFYTASSPDAQPFVTLGDKVKKGDVLCIIEAMKLMNEITAEQDGTIAELCVGNGQVVEYGHPLFRIRP